MASLINRIPRRQELTLVFLTCIFPTHVWSIIGFLRELPSYIMRLNVWEIISIFAYVQVFVLLESLMLTLIITILAILLPGFLIRDRFVPQAGILVLLASFWAALIHYQDLFIGLLPMSEKQFVATWLVSLLGSLAILSVLLGRSARFQTIVHKFIENLSILSILYLAIDIACLIILAVRFVALATS